MAQAADIAVVSFDRFIHGDDADRKAVAKEVYDAFSSVGWVYISDHGIPQDRKSTRLNYSHSGESRMPSSA